MNQGSEEQTSEKGLLKQFPIHDNLNNIVVDAGTNSGQLARLAQEMTSFISVISLEPYPKACKKHKTRMQNFADRCKLIDKGASNKTGKE